MTAIPIPTSFAEQAARTPDATAVSEAASGTALTYRELDRRANQLAHHLIGLGVGPEDRVGVLVERSLGVVVAFLGILKAGAAYLPIHEAYPADRRQWVTDSAGAKVLLVDDAMRATGLPAGVPALAVDDPALAGEPDTAPDVALHPDQLAYVIYTSGSTGRPKGVAVTQGEVVRLLADPAWTPERYERLLLLAPYAFDISVFEILLPLLHGGHVVVAPPGRLEPATLGRLIREHDITGLHLTAGLFRVIAEEAPETLSGLREILTGGDVISPTAITRVLEVCPDVVVHASYGATEATILSTHNLLTAGAGLEGTVPVGDALAGVDVHILDDTLAPVGTGTVGELYLAGEGVARGYLGQPDLTAERFVADPFGAPGARMYRTGDLARRTDGGEVEFIGRVDSQVKILGFLVEPAEVEAALSGHAGLAQVVVLARELEQGDKQLVGYVVPDAGGLDVAGVKEYAATKLPDYMVPSVFVELDALPLTANGKVDRAALPEPAAAGATGGDAGAGTPLQQELQAIFASVLDVPEVGVDDSFFDLGGQSLQAMRLLNRIKDEVGVEVLINVLFDAPTVAELAEHIESERAAA